MKKILLALSLLLIGCTTVPQVIDKPAVSYKYVVVKIPDEMLTVPVPGPKIDVELATDKVTADWMVDWEKRYQEIEKRLKAVKDYQDRRLKELNLPADAVIQN
jgi:hypothetical protein